MRIRIVCEEQGLPVKFLQGILTDLRLAGLVRTRRGSDAGGYLLAAPADQITLGAILRAVDGPLTQVNGHRPHETVYSGSAEHLPDVWVAVRNALRNVLDETSVADVLNGRLPRPVFAMTATEDDWAPH